MMAAHLGLDTNSIIDTLRVRWPAHLAIFTGLPANRVLRLEEFPPLGVKEPKNPVEFRLEQNYPNPFNPVTIIRYSVATEALVTLKVFDVLGREVASLVNKTKAPGTYEAKWSAEGVGSGVYLYRFESGGFMQTKKMILPK